MPTNVRTENKGLVTQYANGTVVQPNDPVILKNGTTGLAKHTNDSSVIHNAAGTVFNKNTKVATRDSYLGAGMHAIDVIGGVWSGMAHGDNGFLTAAKTLIIEGRNAVMHDVMTSVNAAWSMVPMGAKNAIDNGTKIVAGMTLDDFAAAAKEETAAMMEALMSIDTLIALGETLALAAISAIPVVGQIAGGVAVVQRMIGLLRTAGDALDELAEMVDRWSKPMSPEQLAAERKKLAAFFIKVGIGAILAALGKALPKRSRKSKGDKNSDKEINVDKKKEKPKQTSCACAIGNPVIIATGEKSLSENDFDLPGLIPLDWRRSYRSGNVHTSWFGQGWSTPLAVELRLAASELTYHDADGRAVALPFIATGSEHFDAYEEFTLRRPNNDRWEIAFKNGRTECFERVRDDLFALPLSRIVDRNSNRIGFEYPPVPDDPFAPWRPRVIVDSAGRRLHLEWDRRGLLLAVQCRVNSAAPPVTLASYTYATEGDLLDHTNAGGARRSYEWRNHVLTAYTNADAARFCAEYDEYSPFGRVLHSYSAADGRGLHFEYQDRARMTLVTDALGRTTRYEYDERRDIVATTSADGARLETAHDANGNQRGPVDPLGRQTHYRYDGRGNLTEVLNAAGARTAIAYDELGLPIAFTDALNCVWRSEYDVRGNLVTAIDPQQHVTSYAYNERGNVIAVTDALGHKEQLEWDDMGNLTSVTDCSNQRTCFSYDYFGRILTRTDALGHITTYEWNAAGYLVEMHEPGCASHRYKWNANGRLLSYRNPLGAITEYRYNNNGALVLRRNANGHTLRYVYDEVGRLAQLTNENGEVACFKYDAANQLSDEIAFDGRHQRYCYNAAGELTHLIETGGSDFGPGKVTHFERNVLGQVSAKAAEGDVNCRSSFSYDQLGRLMTADNPAAHIEFSYDCFGQILSESQTLHGAEGDLEVKVLKHYYDVLGNRTQTTLPDGRILRWLYYGSGHLHQINLQDEDGESTHRVIVDIERDAMHREISRTQGTLESCYDYDPMGRLKRHKVTDTARNPNSPATLAIERSYHYDTIGNLLGKHDARRGQQSYRYDPVERLINAMGQHTEFFAFDPAGNRLQVPTQRNAGKVTGNRLKALQDLRYSYDPHGNIVTRENSEGEHVHLVWDADHRLQKTMVTRHSVTQSTYYEYDALGRRTRKIDAFGSTDYLWNGNLLIQCNRGAKASLFVFEPDGFVPLATVQNQEIYWYQCDQIGTPHELTNLHGDIVWTLDYMAYGAAASNGDTKQSILSTLRSSPGAATCIDQPFRFQGQIYDIETGFYYNRHRYYDPDTGRYLSPDPIRLAGGTNTYQYTLNPINWVDPFGLAPCGPKINLKHIFHGEINRRNRATGFHHQGSIGHGSNAIVLHRGPSNSHGVYRATVSVFNPATGMYQNKDSTMFPDAWSRQGTLNEIRSAYQDAVNKGNITGNKFNGTSCSGVVIEGYVDSHGNINTAFPII